MILIVDDKSENILSLKKLLELNNFEVDSALSGEEALKKILKNNYFLIILDVQMPGMDGYEVAETISGYSRTKDVPIIFLSAVNTSKKFITQGYGSGGFDYITKPFDPDILLFKVRIFYKIYEQSRKLRDTQTALEEEIEVRKMAQAQLRDKNVELGLTLESIPQVAFTATPDGRIEFVNKQWFKYSKSKAVFPETHKDDADLEQKWKESIALGNPLELEIRICKITANQFEWHLLRAVPVKENNVIIKWVGTFTNIDEQKQAEHQKDEFLSIASHELKTPLTSIKAYVQLLDQNFKNNSSDALNTIANTKQYLARTGAQVDKLCTLVNDLLDVSKIESGKMKFNKKDFNFKHLLHDAVDIMQKTYSDYKIDLQGDGDVMIHGDEVRIEQVLINYLSNAIKYSPDEKEINIHADLTKEGRLVIKVKDSGIGIKEEDQPGIFQKYYRVEGSSHRFQGLGIGLYICAEILKKHSGDYGVESKLGKGSTFYFSLPLSNN